METNRDKFLQIKGLIEEAIHAWYEAEFDEAARALRYAAQQATELAEIIDALEPR